MTRSQRGEPPPILDHAILDDLFDYVGVEAARPVIDIFLGECRDFTVRIREAATDAAGRDVVRRTAHSLKSGAGQLGAAALAAVADALEHAAGNGKGDLTGLIGTLAECAAATDAAMVELLRRRS